MKILIGLKIIAKLPILTSKTKYLTSLHYPSEYLIPFFAPTQNNEIDLTEDVASWISITIIIDWLVFNANSSSISAILWHELISFSQPVQQCDNNEQKFNGKRNIWDHGVYVYCLINCGNIWHTCIYFIFTQIGVIKN